MILHYDIWVMDYLNPYFEALEDKFQTGKIDIRKFDRLATKLDEWEEEHIRKYGINYYDPEDCNWTELFLCPFLFVTALANFRWSVKKEGFYEENID